MKINDFDFQLPEELIAQKPAHPRDTCRLMVLNPKKKKIGHYKFTDLTCFLKKSDVLVFNNSKVFPARLQFTHHGKRIELLLTKKIDDNKWLAIGKPGKFLQPGKIFTLQKNLTVEIVNILKDGQKTLSFSKSGKELEKLLEKLGRPPFPPYIKNESISLEEYQTVYAKIKGSVAAPTAGLHFTESLLKKLRERGIETIFATLHVGLGTFLPIRAENIENHLMHSEWYNIDSKSTDALNKAKKEHRRIIAVGTTALRVLETCFDEKRGFLAGFGETSIFIYPGYKWKCTDGLITNFHLPKSTLFLLVCAFAETKFIHKAYKEAIKKLYRFYSFGDAMLILKR